MFNKYNYFKELQQTMREIKRTFYIHQDISRGLSQKHLYQRLSNLIISFQNYRFKYIYIY